MRRGNWMDHVCLFHCYKNRMLQCQATQNIYNTFTREHFAEIYYRVVVHSYDHLWLLIFSVFIANRTMK
jgi:hypothetical protein